MRTTLLWMLALAACGKDTDLDLPVDTDGTDAPIDSDVVDTDAVDTEVDDTLVETGGGDSDDTDTGPRVVSCGASIPAPVTGVCDATPGTTAAVLLRGDVLAPDAIYEGGSVLIDAHGAIACVGCDCSAEPAAADAARVDCVHGVISPGLIDANDHLTYDEAGPLPESAARYDHRHAWREELTTPVNEHGTGRSSAGTRWSELRHLLAGTTSVVGAGGANGLVRNPDLGADASGGLPEIDVENFPLGDADPLFHEDCAWSYRQTTSEVARLPGWIGQVGTGIDDRATEEARCLTTGLDGGEDLAEGNTAFQHAVGLTTLQLAELARGDTKLVWSPRSNLQLYGNTAAVQLFARLGGTIALGTDWAYTGSATMLRELACADAFDDVYLGDAFDDADLWRMATAGGAAAIAAEGKVGVLAERALGDVAVFDGRTNGGHRAVVAAGAVDVRLVLRGGVVLYGEADTITELGTPSCDALDVCGDARAVCLQAELGVGYDDLAAGVGEAYPAFTCGVPADEPTCVPARPDEYDGASTQDDLDGDGVANADDACPRVFDPVRPLDHGAQPDLDGDGRGDACDATPLPEDADGDGTVTRYDVCPYTSDAGVDQDADGHGDACDACPTTPNPTSLCTPSLWTIPDLRAGAPPTEDVAIEAVVTAAKGTTATLQDATVVDGVDAGLLLLGAPVAVGRKVRVEGSVSEVVGELTLQAHSVTDLGAAVLPAPIPLLADASQAAVEAYEGVLVTIDGSVTDLDYDCSVDASGCTDAPLWEVDGPTGVLVDRAFYTDADFVEHVHDMPITGVMRFRWGRWRIEPRTASDFGP